MQANKSTVAAAGAAAVLVTLVLAGVGQGQTQLPLEPIRDRGQAVTPAYEGWFKNPDGTFTLLVGYFNRNRTEILDIPVGPNNRIEPAGPDRGQPTHFLARRQWGVFTIQVPADFGNNRLTWTLVSNGETNAIPLGLHPAYEVNPFEDPAMGNKPPVLKFTANGPELVGPPRGTATTLSARVGVPLPLTFWAVDDNHVEPGGGGRGNQGPQARVFLTKHRGPGDVTFDNVRPDVNHADGGRVTATATFSAPGEYVVRVQVNDSTGEGGGGFQCCWTNAHVRVNVAPASGD
jgi:hypothetical protein